MGHAIQPQKKVYNLKLALLLLFFAHENNFYQHVYSFDLSNPIKKTHVRRQKIKVFPCKTL